MGGARLRDVVAHEGATVFKIVLLLLSSLLLFFIIVNLYNLSKYISSKFLSLFSLIVSHPRHVLIKFGGSQLL